MPSVAVIGAGASGMAFAVALKLKRPDAEVTVFEKNPKALKKILVTGNGRCNILNFDASADDYFGARDFVRPATEKYTPQRITEFFRGIGLVIMRGDEGRAYPISQSAASVVCVISSAAEREGVKVITDTHIKSIRQAKGGFIINNDRKFDFVVLACGGAAAPKQGTDGTSFDLFKSLGIRVTELYPALTGLSVKDMPFSLKGLRQYCKCTVSLGEKKYCQEGEVQFNDYGLSGIPIMQLSRFIGKGKAAVTLDCLPSLTKNEVTKFLQSHKYCEPSGDVLCGILPRALSNYILLKCNVKKDEPFSNLSSNKTLQIASAIKSLEFSVTGVRGFDFAQVTRGGAALSEFDKNTLESKKVKHLYAVGEALDVDGPCGGYNLGWAWSSALLAAESVLKEL
ncbi:MAG: aminoacetone oxidase family FAD-binding enzyme [Ruminococcus sp.]|nr:aminoacetone oxidase family FAD-binding enzyme [Ruminococcus sp.]